MATGHEAADPWPAGLTDAPEELGAWIVEKLHTGRDDRGELGRRRPSARALRGPAGG